MAKFAATIDADTSSSATYVSPLALEIANLLAVSTQLWSVSVSKASPQTPAEADFEVVQRVIGVAVVRLGQSLDVFGITSSRSFVARESAVDDAVVRHTRVESGRAFIENRAAELRASGQSALPLIPLVCHARGHCDARHTQGDVEHGAHAARRHRERLASDVCAARVLSAHKILPPLKPATGDFFIVDSVTIAALNTCLSLSQSEQGAEILLASDTVRQLAVLCVESSNAKTATDHDIYCSALRGHERG